MAEILALVEARLRSAFGEPDARAAVTFLGTDRIEVLRFAEGDLVRYATLGMSAHPMTDPTDVVADPVRGPRAELVLTVRAGIAPTDKLLRPLAVLAASPGGGPDRGPRRLARRGRSALGRGRLQLRPRGRTGGLVEDLELDEPMDPVRFLPFFR